MAEEQTTAPPAEEQPTTALEASTDTTTEVDNTMTEVTDTSATTATAAAESKDTEMTEAETDPATAGEQATTEVTAPDGETTQAEPTATDGPAATPASAKGKRKSTSGVPEHKGKKLNKRKSMARLITDAEPGDYFFAKFKGYSPWPSIICPEDMLPETLLATRPVSTEDSQGNLREDFKEGGKNAKDRTYPIMFLETNEFAWIVNSALTPLNPGDTAEDKLKPKMSASLRNAYILADERHDLDYFRSILAEHQEAEKQLQEEIAAKEAEKQEKEAKKEERAAKASEKTKGSEKKAKRKSTAKSKDAVTDEDEMDVDDKESVEAKPSKKRKKDADSDAEGAKPKKTPKTIKLKADKTPNGDSAKKAEKREKKKVTKPTEVEEEKEVLTEEQKLERREKAVLYLRHRLQKAFLSRDQAPKEEEMDGASEFFTQLESFADLEPQVIRNTKINKVLKGIVKLASIPKEDEHNFKKRSNDLLAQWNNALDQNRGGETPGATSVPAVETPNGDGEAKTNGDGADKQESIETKAENEPVEITDAGNDAKDEANDDVAMTDAKDDKPAEPVEAITQDKEEETNDKEESKTEDMEVEKQEEKTDEKTDEATTSAGAEVETATA